MTEPLKDHKIVPENEWFESRKALLKKEKEFTISRDQLSQQRRDLPWMAVNKEYVFEGPNGKQTLSELFDGKSQLIVYHFMFDPSWEAACLHCSFWADNFNGIIVHLNQRDVTMIAVSRAQYSKLTAYRKRMGWDFKWGFFLRYRFQFRLPRVIQTGRVGQERSLLQLHYTRPAQFRAGRSKHILQRPCRSRVSHLFSLCAWHRYVECGIPLP